MSGASEYGPATSRIFRLMVLAVGPASVVFGALEAENIVTRFQITPAWWSLPTLAATLGVPLVASVLSWRASVRTLRMLMAVTAVGYAVAMVLFLPALGGTSIPGDASPWILGLTAIGTTAGAIAWGAWLAWSYVMLISVLTAADRIAAADPGIAATAGLDALYSLMFCSVFAGLALIAARAGRTLDAAADAARTEVSQAAADRARAQETARIDGLVHDTVLATLLVAARGGEAQRTTAVAGAEHALAQLDALRHPSGGGKGGVGGVGFADGAGTSGSWLAGYELVWRVQSATTDLDPDAQFSYEVTLPDAAASTILGPVGGPVPVIAAQAIVEATMEALRNSLRHAGGTDARRRAEHPVTRAVHVRLAPDTVEVTVLDDGVGFDASAVDPGRLGIQVSIRSRMSRLTGGRSTIVSRIGHGTRVQLEWRRP